MQSTTDKDLPTLLYVEDEDTDLLFMRLAVERANFRLQLKAVGNGQEAIRYLSGENGYADRKEHPLPTLVLLDLKLPVISGFDLLEWIRHQPKFQGLPVVVFSSSVIARDKAKADAMGANGYLLKPSSVEQFREVLEQVVGRWLSRSGDAGTGRERPVLKMRKLIQSQEDKRFLAERGDWTSDWRRARVFSTTEAARAAAVQHQGKRVELYYLFGEAPSRYDFTVPFFLLGEAWPGCSYEPT